MTINKEAIAVTLLAIFTAAIIAFIIILSEQAISSKNAAPPPTSISSSRIRDSVVEHTHFDHQKKNNKNINNSLVSFSTKLPAMFVIGDSSVSCGENSLFFPGFRNTLSIFPCSNASDSTLIPHFISSKMGLSNISSFYNQNGTIEGILTGLNYGSPGATILTSLTGPNFQTLNQQLRQTFETIQLIQLQLGESQSISRVNSSIFYLSLGKEDFINFLFKNTTLITPDFNTAAKAFSELLANEMINAVESLYNVGARKIVTFGILPLGCSPRAVVEWYFRNGRNTNNNIRMKGCVDEINQVVLEYNQMLNERIIALNLKSSDAQFVFCDAFQGLSKIISNPKKYGFGNTRGACCGRGWRGAAVGCESMSMACNNMSSYVWWDFYNPTQAVNSFLAESAWSGKPFTDMCRPVSVRSLVDARIH